MIRLLRYDLKRIFAGKALLALCLLAPLTVILLFALVIAPMIITADGLHFNVAILDEDGSENVSRFIGQLVTSHALADLITVYPVPDLAAGLSLVAEDQVSVLVHIPQGLFERIRAHESVTVDLISQRGHAMESALIAITLNQSLRSVGQGQNQLDLAYRLLLEHQADTVAADRFLARTTLLVLTGYMNRRETIGEDGALSPLGDYLPVDYYLVAVYVFFAALALLPLIHFTARDLNSAILQRGLLNGLSSQRYFLVRLTSGTCLIFLVLLMLLPAGHLLKQLNSLTGSTYDGNLAAILLAALLLALSYAAMALAAAVWIRSQSLALWVGFYLVLFMAVSGGVFVPAGVLPQAVSEIGLFLPLRSGLRSLANALFFFQPDAYWPDLMRLLVISAVLLAFGRIGLVRRETRL
jgi:hypothetical protein